MRKTIVILSLLWVWMGFNFVLYGTGNTNIQERTIEEIAVSWPNGDSILEFSGMDWYKNHLIIMPQRKQFMEEVLLKKNGESKTEFYYIPKQMISKYLEQGNNDKSICPFKLKVSVKGFSNLSCLCNGKLEFEGFEAIAFHQEKNIVFLTIEANINKIMKGFLVRGEIDPDTLCINVDLYNWKPVKIPMNVKIENFSYETLLVTDKKVIAIYEANGEKVNSSPKAYVYDLKLENSNPISFPNIDYRITDATAPDQDYCFWCINYYWPGEKEKLLPPENDSIESYCNITPPSRQSTEIIERLVEFKYKKSKIELVNCSIIPIKQESRNPKCGRNWEGIVRFEDTKSKKDGFLVVTDQYPRTIFGFVSKK